MTHKLHGRCVYCHAPVGQPHVEPYCSVRKAQVSKPPTDCYVQDGINSLSCHHTELPNIIYERLAKGKSHVVVQPDPPSEVTYLIQTNDGRKSKCRAGQVEAFLEGALTLEGVEIVQFRKNKP